jgi:hypothetical protein
MNHPFGACYSHFQEVADLASELQKHNLKYKSVQDKNDYMPVEPGPLPVPVDSMSDIDVDMFMEHHDLGESDRGMDDGLFIEEYEGSAKEYGTSTTFMEEFDRDRYAGERGENLYYPFASRDEWEFAAFLLRSDLSMASIDSLLSLNLVSVACNFAHMYI